MGIDASRCARIRCTRVYQLPCEATLLPCMFKLGLALCLALYDPLLHLLFPVFVVFS